MFAQLVFDLGRVSDQIKLVDLFVITQRHNGAGNEGKRTKVTAHRGEGDLHQSETLLGKTVDCKAKFVAASLSEASGACDIWRRSQSDGYNHLLSSVNTC